MKTTYTFIVSLLLFSVNSFSQQKNISLYLSHYYNGEVFELESELSLEDDIKCKISRLEYYLTLNTIEANNGDKIEFSGVFVTAEGSSIDYPGKQILVNTQKHLYEIGSYDVSDLSNLDFHIGIPPEINHQDPAIWNINHPLAPQNPSMHWGWSAGYRFLALEAIVDEDSDTVFESILQYHAIGDVLYNSINLNISTVETEDEITIYLDVNYEKLLQDINASNAGVFHGEPEQVVALMNNFSTNSVFTNAENLNLEQTTLLKSIAPNPFSSNLNIELEKATQLKIYNLIGSLLSEQTLEKGSNTIDTQELKQGVYIFKLENELKTETYKLLKN
tara:strand:- start:64 stop:1062 length:999 start_codon:yes stop_codon:yes gene_type:complete